MKKLGRYFLSLLIVATAWSASPVQWKTGHASITFSQSNPPSAIYIVEMKTNNIWRPVGFSNKSPASFMMFNVSPGTYTFRLKGQILSTRPIATTISNEVSYTISPQTKIPLR